MLGAAMIWGSGPTLPNPQRRRLQAFIPHAGSDETVCSLRKLRLLAPEAPGAHQAPKRGFAASWWSRKRLGGSRRQRELAAPESLARRRTRSVRPEGPPPPPAETSSRLEMVLLCPFGMSHVGAREVFTPRGGGRLAPGASGADGNGALARMSTSRPREYIMGAFRMLALSLLKESTTCSRR